MIKYSHGSSVGRGLNCLPPQLNFGYSFSKTAFVIPLPIPNKSIRCFMVTTNYRCYASNVLSAASLPCVNRKLLRQSGRYRTGHKTRRDGTLEHRSQEGTRAIGRPNNSCFTPRPGCACTLSVWMPCAHRIVSVRMSTSSCRIFSASGTSGGGFIPPGSRVGAFPPSDAGKRYEMRPEQTKKNIEPTR